MNILERNRIKTGIFSLLYIFFLLVEPFALSGENVSCLYAQVLLQDTLSDTFQTLQTADSIVNVQISKVYFPPFLLPDTVQGYTLSTLEGYASANCPSKEVPPGEPMNLYFQFVNDSLLNYVTPIFLTILETTLERTVVQVYGEQYHISPGRNLIRLNADLPPGNYQLIYGFYLREQLNEKFPRLYAKRCHFQVLEVVAEPQ